jgi:hypothetical protein
VRVVMTICGHDGVMEISCKMRIDGRHDLSQPAPPRICLFTLAKHGSIARQLRCSR